MTVERFLVGFAKFDGDEFHGFVYYKPGDSLDVMARSGYYEVFCEMPQTGRGNVEHEDRQNLALWRKVTEQTGRPT